MRLPLTAWLVFFGTLLLVFAIDWAFRGPGVEGVRSGGIGMTAYWGLQAIAALVSTAVLTRWVWREPKGRWTRSALSVLQVGVGAALWVVACLAYSFSLGYYL